MSPEPTCLRCVLVNSHLPLTLKENETAARTCVSNEIEKRDSQNEDFGLSPVRLARTRLHAQQLMLAWSAIATVFRVACGERCVR